MKKKLPFSRMQDTVHEEEAAADGSNHRVFTGVTKKRIILVLDCLTPHDFK